MASARTRKPVNCEPGFGVFLVRAAATIFALFLLVFVPALVLFLYFVPQQRDLLEIFSRPLQILVRIIAGIILFFLMWIVIAMIRGYRAKS